MYKALSLISLAAVISLVASSHATQGTLPAVPVVVAKVALTNQMQPIPTTTIFTPAYTGLFRISPYWATAVNGPNSWELNMNWTDDFGQQSAELMSMYGQDGSPTFGKDANLGELTVGSFTFRAVAGQPVTFNVAGGSGGPYALFLLVERMP